MKTSSLSHDMFPDVLRLSHRVDCSHLLTRLIQGEKRSAGQSSRRIYVYLVAQCFEHFLDFSRGRSSLFEGRIECYSAVVTANARKAVGFQGCPLLEVKLDRSL